METAERIRLNNKGRIQGYSSCLICRDSWIWKEHHSISFPDGSNGTFPYCQECHETKPVEAKVAAAMLLTWQWQHDIDRDSDHDSDKDHFHGMPWDQLRRFLREAIKDGQ